MTRDRDRPWMMRTYAGHSTPDASNALYRSNLEKGQTGLSIAFDLPTQTGYDPDDVLAAGEVGKVGVPIVHLGHMQTLLDGIPVGQMNTSMTINAPASWLLALHIANAETQGVARAELRGTTQNDIVKEYLSRGTYIFPPEPSLRLIVDMIAFCAAEVPAWNPINICSYHLQEAGATPVQELSFALANAVAVLDAVRASGQVADDAFGQVVGSVSFFVNAGIRFVEETAKMRAFTQMWEQITRDRYGVTDPKQRRFRYGVQVNSLGLTESQPENNVQRIVLEMLGVTLSKDARARSIQLPAWNEALGLPRPWDQQWALRMQQVLAFETDLLEYDDIFAGSHVIEALTSDLMADAWSELNGIIERGGAFAAIEDMKRSLVESNARRVRSIETGDTTVVGRNHFTESEPSALGGSEAILRVDPHVGQQMVADVEQWRTSRDRAAAEAAIDELRRVASSTENIMAATIECARAGVTTGEWAHALRGVFGEFQGPTGVAHAAAVGTAALGALASFHQGLADGPPKVLIAKPGLDGHSNGAEQIALAARDSGMEVVYQGIRRTPDQIAATARDEDVDLIGLSVLSGSHVELVPAVLAALAAVGVHAPVIVGGIIPGEDHEALRSAGVARIYTPSDYEIGAMMSDLSELALAARD
ncbi:methylmalonyl-CoA mutase family protein [Acidimicrobiales bacterium]|nr:methylmalonyl-CoA mutase family protein [Acidimicrobiales bacterium]